MLWHITSNCLKQNCRYKTLKLWDVVSTTTLLRAPNANCIGTNQRALCTFISSASPIPRTTSISFPVWLRHQRYHFSNSQLVFACAAADKATANHPILSKQTCVLFTTLISTLNIKSTLYNSVPLVTCVEHKLLCHVVNKSGKWSALTTAADFHGLRFHFLDGQGVYTQASCFHCPKNSNREP